MMKKKQKKAGTRKAWQLKKPMGIGIFYTVCLLVGILVATHQNPLAQYPEMERLKKICACALLAMACIIYGIYYDRIFVLPKELYQSRELIWKLAKNEFK